MAARPLWETGNPLLDLDALLEVQIQKITPTKVFYFFKNPKSPTGVSTASVYHQNVSKYAYKMVNPPPGVEFAGEIDPYSYKGPQKAGLSITPDLPKKEPKSKIKPKWTSKPWVAPSKPLSVFAPIGLGSPPIPPPVFSLPKPPEEPAIKIAAPVPHHLDLEFVGSGQYLGGAGEKSIYKDGSGKKWIFKRAASKDGSLVKPYAAEAQQAFYTTAVEVKPEHKHLPVGTETVGGQYGTLQPLLELGDPPTLAGVDPKSLSKLEKFFVASEHVLDWLFSQHDSHGGNLIRTKDSKVVLGVDKEQAFKYFGTDELDIGYHPNAQYGEKAPYYNTFWGAWSTGEIDFDPKDLESTIENVEGLDTKKYLGTLKPYAEAFFKDNPDDQEEFLDKAKKRKLAIRKDFEQFISNLYEKRTGQGGFFTFTDGWVPSGEKPGALKKVYTASEHAVKEGVKEYPYSTGSGTDTSKTTLKLAKGGHSKEELEKFLKDVGLQSQAPVITGSSYHIAVVDAEDYKKATITTFEAVKEGVKPQPAKPRYFPDVPSPKKADRNFDELSKVPDLYLSPNGKRIDFDGVGVEGQQLRVKKFRSVSDPSGGSDYYLYHFKARGPLLGKLHALGGHDGWRFPVANYDAKSDIFVETGTNSFATDAKRITSGNVEIFTASNPKNYAFYGGVYAKVKATESDPSGALKEALNSAEAGLGDKIFQPSKEEDVETRKLMQALWSFSPQSHDKLTQPTSKETVKEMLLDVGVDSKKLDQIEEKEVLPGYSTFVEKGRWKRLAGGKFRFLFHGVSDTSRFISILQKGLMGIHERSLSGQAQVGGSPSADIDSGSADNILLRPVTDSGLGKDFTAHSFHGDFQLLISPDELDRLDAYMHMSDSYGATNPDSSAWTGRRSIEERMNQQQKNYQSSAELGLRKGVSSSRFLRAVTSSESSREGMIKAAKKAGINEVNGVPIDDFVVVEPSMKAAYEKYVKPLGY